MTATISRPIFTRLRGSTRGNQYTVVCWETAATAAAATAWRCSAVPSMRASLTLRNQFIIMKGSKIAIRDVLTVGDAEFQLQLAEASWRVDSGSSQGT